MIASSTGRSRGRLDVGGVHIALQGSARPAPSTVTLILFHALTRRLIQPARCVFGCCIREFQKSDTLFFDLHSFTNAKYNPTLLIGNLLPKTRGSSKRVKEALALFRIGFQAASCGARWNFTDRQHVDKQQRRRRQQRRSVVKAWKCRQWGGAPRAYAARSAGNDEHDQEPAPGERAGYSFSMLLICFYCTCKCFVPMSAVCS